MALVESLATRRLISAGSDESVAAAIRRMAENEVGAIVVVDDGELRGIFSERDALKRVLAAGLDPEETTLERVLTPDPITVAQTDSIKTCAERVREHGIRHVPVVDGEGKPVGMISSRDFLHYIVDELEALIERANQETRRQELVDPFSVIGEGGW